MTATFHLVPADAWADAAPDRAYAPPSLADEGFVHCTNGEDEVLRTGDRYYRDDRRDWLVLTVDLERTDVSWTVEDPERRYPHVHGPIDRAAIIAVRRVVRASDGSFVGISPIATQGGPATTRG